MSKRKRYIVFEYEQYYPCGAKGDEVARVDSLEEIPKGVPMGDKYHEYRDVLDLDSGEWLETEELEIP